MNERDENGQGKRGDRQAIEALRQLQSRKMGIEPAALRRAPPAIVARYADPWAPVAELAGHLGRYLPAGILRFLAGHRYGYLVVDWRTSYEPQDALVQGKHWSHVVHVNLAEVGEPFPCLCAVASLLDHLLGCDGDPAGPWLSEGGGITPPLSAFGRECLTLYELGYGVDKKARCSRRDYFARSLTWYAVDRRRLNIADPRMERLLKHTLMDDRFWSHLLVAGL